MELLRGETLGERVRQGRLRAMEALPLVEQIAAGLAAAHRAGIVRRDQERKRDAGGWRCAGGGHRLRSRAHGGGRPIGRGRRLPGRGYAGLHGARAGAGGGGGAGC